MEQASTTKKANIAENANTTEKVDVTELVDPITMHPSALLRCVAGSMNWKDTEIFVTVSSTSTWKTVLRAIDAALGQVDHFCMVTHERTEAQKLRSRQIALENVAAEKASSSGQPSPLRPIRTKYDVTSLPSPKRIPEEARKRLKEDLIPFDKIREPYHATITANITENTLPIFKANVRLIGIDSKNGDPHEEFKLIDVLWDTGAQQTIISEELLSEQFRHYLQDSINDPYRSPNCLRVQLEAVVALTNVPVRVSAISLVVPKSVVPNQRVGIIFGQKQCIDRMHYESLPRRILQLKGEEIDEEVWGDFVIHEVINEDGNLVRV